MSRGPLTVRLVVTLLAAVCVPAVARAEPFAYVAAAGPGTVSVIDVATNTIVASIAVPRPDPMFEPSTLQTNGVVLSPSGTRAYVTHSHGFSVIDTVSRTVPGGVISEVPGARP